MVGPGGGKGGRGPGRGALPLPCGGGVAAGGEEGLALGTLTLEAAELAEGGLASIRSPMDGKGAEGRGRETRAVNGMGAGAASGTVRGSPAARERDAEMKGKPPLSLPHRRFPPARRPQRDLANRATTTNTKQTHKSGALAWKSESSLACRAFAGPDSLVAAAPEAEGEAPTALSPPLMACRTERGEGESRGRRGRGTGTER